MLVESLDGKEQQVVFRHVRKRLHNQSAGAVRVLTEHVDLRCDFPTKVVHVDCLGLERFERAILDHGGEDFRPAMA